MLREKVRLLRKIYFTLDLCITAFSFFFAYFLENYFDFSARPIGHISHYLFLLYIILPLWAILLVYFKVYQPIRTMHFLYVSWTVLKSIITGSFILIAILFVFKHPPMNREFILLFLSVNVLFLIIWRYSIYVFLHHIRRKGYNYRNILIVGTGKRAREFANNILKHKEWGLKIIGFVDVDSQLFPAELNRVRVVGSIDELPSIITGFQIDEVVFIVPKKWLDKIEKAVLLCENVGIKTRIAADFYPHAIAKIRLEDFHGSPFLTFNPAPNAEITAAIKRGIDISLALLLLTLIAPFFAFIALAIKLTSPGPVLFKQERCGLNGRRFKILKFRTMINDAEALKSQLKELNEMSGPVFKIKRDPRVTTVGRFLRKFSLDEIPQFINVLKGDMSIVGPRPPIPSEVSKYDLWQRRRLSVRPGITCLWQINGRNGINFEEWMKLDLEYIDKWSLKLDMKIIIKTVPVMLRGTGV